MSQAEEEEPGHGNGIGELLDLLSSPLDDDDDLTVVLTRRPGAKLPSLTLVLAAVVVASAGFLGGAMVGKNYGSSSSGSLAAAFRGLAARASASAGSGGTGSGSGGSGSGGSGSGGTGSGSGFGFGGGRGGAFGGGNATIGTIKLIDGRTVYVQTTAGGIVQVATSAGTKVTVSSAVPVKGLQPGETVIVEGGKNSSGAIAATSISQTSLGG
ncbi:MAG TPA: hypothetical protein VK280_18195 [Streptosporangiaceae bacterium]|nr:hypothetical protein [Streptosporangiaceae bacterium]